MTRPATRQAVREQKAKLLSLREIRVIERKSRKVKETISTNVRSRRSHRLHDMQRKVTLSRVQQAADHRLSAISTTSTSLQSDQSSDNCVVNSTDFLNVEFCEPRFNVSRRLFNIQNKTQKVTKSVKTKVNDKTKKSIDSVKHPLLACIDKKLLDQIKADIIVAQEAMSFDDIAGLDEAKKFIHEAVVLPLQRPDIFTGLRRVPKGILLFGPPGTGKTMIAKCIARQSNATFFCISSASITSKWHGESEKLIRALFLFARVKQPSVIFIDEIDSIIKQRSSNEHDGSRRIKTEFLLQLEGAMTNYEDNVMVVGATNLPQELDEAAKRRFQRRLYIPLPDYAARRQLLTILLRQNENDLDKGGLVWIAAATEGYSGSDIKQLCTEAAFGPIRDIPKAELITTNLMNLRPIQLKDFREGVKRVKPTVSKDSLKSYVEWNEAYGST